MGSFKELWVMTEDIQVLNELMEQEDIDQQTYDDTMESLMHNMEDSVNELTTFNASIKGKIEEAKFHKKRITEYAQFLERKEERLKRFLGDFLAKTGLEKVEGSLGKISLRKSKSVEVYDAVKLPNECLNVTHTYKPDKNKIKELINSGVEIPGARIVEKKNVQIK